MLGGLAADSHFSLLTFLFSLARSALLFTIMQIVPPPTPPYGRLTYNESHEFTRRLPTYITRQQAERDAKIARQLIVAHDIDCDTDKVLNIWFTKSRLLSNPAYWEILRTVWVAVGDTSLVPKFLPYFRSKRGARSWFMTVEDAATLDAMQFPIQLWRAYDDDNDIGISWTRDKEWCEGYARSRNRRVKTALFNRTDIFAYISRRGEEEFIILH